jgi:hypothetical protein
MGLRFYLLALTFFSWSFWSAALCPGRVPALPAPRNLSAEILRSELRLVWEPVPAADSYRVFVDFEGESAARELVTEPRFAGRLQRPGLYRVSVASIDSRGAEGPRSRALRAIRFDRPWGIALTRDGRRIVRDAHLARQAVLDRDGRAVGLYGPEGLTLEGSYDVAVDRSGRILTAKWAGSSEPAFGFVVQDRGFRVVREYLRPAGSADGEFRQPMGIGADSRGSIFIADTGNNRVQQFTRDGKFVRVIGESELRLPMKVTFDDRDRLYVADSGNNRIAVYELGAEGGYKLARSITGMKEPVYVAVDRNGCVFASANRVAGVHMYAPDGKELWKYEGDSAAHLSGPRGLAVDGKGNLLIVDEASLRVLSVRIPASASAGPKPALKPRQARR